jgi:spore maturation protein CgeB
MTVRDELVLHHSGIHSGLLEGLTACGVKLIDWTPETRIGERTLGAMTWFYEPLRSPLKMWTFKRQLRAQGAPLVAWNRDAPHYLNRAPWRLDLLDRARLLDIYATHTLADEKRAFADLKLYLANAADPRTYNAGPDPAATLAAMRDPASYDYDVCFFGAMDGKRHKEMQAREDFFAVLGPKLAECGIRHLFQEVGDMTHAEQVALVRKSRINLNYGASCEYLAPFASGLPERCYGIPACGGFLLSDTRTHARDDFTPGENWAEFDGVDDCVEKITYWLAHFDQARDLAERCYAHVMAHHTYAHRAGKLHQALLAWHEGSRGLIR